MSDLKLTNRKNSLGNKHRARINLSSTPIHSRFINSAYLKRGCQPKFKIKSPLSTHFSESFRKTQTSLQKPLLPRTIRSPSIQEKKNRIKAAAVNSSYLLMKSKKLNGDLEIDGVKEKKGEICQNKFKKILICKSDEIALKQIHSLKLKAIK